MHIIKQQLQHAQPIAAVALPPTQPCLNSLHPFSSNQLLHLPGSQHPTSASQPHVQRVSATCSQFLQTQPVECTQFSSRQLHAVNPTPFSCSSQILNSVPSQNVPPLSFSRLVDVLSSVNPSGSANQLQKNPIPNPRAAFVDGLVDITSSIINSVWPNHSFSSKAKLLPIQRFVQEILRRSRTSFSTLQLALLYLLRIKNELPAFRERINELEQFAELRNQCSAQKPATYIPAPSGLDFCTDFPMSPVSPQGQLSSSSDRSGFGTIEQLPSESSTVVNGKNHPSLCGRRMFLAALVVAGKYLQDQTYSNRAWAKISGLSVQEINQNELEFLKVIDYRLHVNNDTFLSWSHMLMTWANFNKTRRERAAIASEAFPTFHPSTPTASASNEVSESSVQCNKRQRTAFEPDVGILSPNDNSEQPNAEFNAKWKLNPVRVSETSYLPSPAADTLSFAGATQPASAPGLDMSNIGILVQALHKLHQLVPQDRKRKRGDDIEDKKCGQENILALLTKLNSNEPGAIDIPSWIANVQAANASESTI